MPALSVGPGVRRRHVLAIGAALFAGSVEPGAVRSPGNRDAHGIASMPDEALIA